MKKYSVPFEEHFQPLSIVSEELAAGIAPLYFYKAEDCAIWSLIDGNLRITLPRLNYPMPSEEVMRLVEQYGPSDLFVFNRHTGEIVYDIQCDMNYSGIDTLDPKFNLLNDYLGFSGDSVRYQCFYLYTNIYVACVVLNHIVQIFDGDQIVNNASIARVVEYVMMQNQDLDFSLTAQGVVTDIVNDYTLRSYDASDYKYDEKNRFSKYETSYLSYFQARFKETVNNRPNLSSVIGAVSFPPSVPLYNIDMVLPKGVRNVVNSNGKLAFIVDNEVTDGSISVKRFADIMCVSEELIGIIYVKKG